MDAKQLPFAIYRNERIGISFERTFWTNLAQVCRCHEKWRLQIIVSKNSLPNKGKNWPCSITSNFFPGITSGEVYTKKYLNLSSVLKAKLAKLPSSYFCSVGFHMGEEVRRTPNQEHSNIWIEILPVPANSSALWWLSINWISPHQLSSNSLTAADIRLLPYM